MVKLLKLNKLSKEVKEKIYNKFLNNYKYYFEVSFYDEWNSQRLIDIGFYKNDCKISSFYHNFYMRTNKAVKGERYNNLSTCFRELKKLCNQCSYYKTSSNIHVYYGLYKKHLFDIEF